MYTAPIKFIKKLRRGGLKMKEIAAICEVHPQNLSAFMGGAPLDSVAEGINYGFDMDYPLRNPEVRSIRRPAWLAALRHKIPRPMFNIIEQEAYVNEDLAKYMATATSLEEVKAIRQEHNRQYRNKHSDASSLLMWDSEPTWHHEPRRGCKNV